MKAEVAQHGVITWSERRSDDRRAVVQIHPLAISHRSPGLAGQAKSPTRRFEPDPVPMDYKIAMHDCGANHKGEDGICWLLMDGKRVEAEFEDSAAALKCCRVLGVPFLDGSKDMKLAQELAEKFSK